MKTIILIVFVVLFHQMCFSQKEIIVDGIAQIEFPSYKSLDEVKNDAKEAAIINALEQAFGSVIFSGTSIKIENTNINKQVETKNCFAMYGNTLVKGECMAILDTSFTEIAGIRIVEGKKVTIKEMKCDVKIKARELTRPIIDIETYSLSYPNLKAKTYDFKNGDTLYLYFKSPVSGYITIYLDDFENTYRILPVSGSNIKTELGYKVDADKEYILLKDLPSYYVLVTNKIKEMNMLYIIFSKEPLNKPALKNNIENGLLTEQNKQNGFTIPEGLTTAKFQKWLQSYRAVSKDMQVNYINITIEK